MRGRDAWGRSGVPPVLVQAAASTGGSAAPLALLRGALSADAAWQAAHVDEDWNMAQWGEDEMAMQRRAFRFAEFAAAAKILSTLRE